MRIEVTREDIRDGTVLHPGACPLALAISRASGRDYVLVGPDTVSVWEENHIERKPLTGRARGFPLRFDMWGRLLLFNPWAAFSFDLDI